MSKWNDYTKGMSGSQLRRIERMADKENTQYNRENGTGDWNTIFNRIAREQHFDCPLMRRITGRYQ